MTTNNPAHKTAWAWIAGTFFGAGLLKPGPGTYGSIAATLIWFAIARVTQAAPTQLALIAGLLCILATAIGIPAATRVARESGRKDPQMVVIDEAAGQWLTLLWAKPTWQQALLALLLFRLFDILKPPPVRQLEALPEGLGIMADDLAAGLYGLIFFLLITHFLHLG